MYAIYVMPTARHALIILMIVAALVPLATSNGSKVDQDAAIIVMKALTLQEGLWANTSTQAQVSPIGHVLHVMLDASFVRTLMTNAINVKTIIISWTIRNNAKPPSLIIALYVLMRLKFHPQTDVHPEINFANKQTAPNSTILK
jgi:hypothetical protein